MDSTNKTTEEQNLADLAAVFNDREITDETGKPTGGEEPSTQAPAAEEPKTPVDKQPTAEKPAEEPAEAPKAPEDSTEPELAEDNTGRRYVPESRFKEVYGKHKATERELQALKQQLEQGKSLLKPGAKPAPQQDQGETPTKADVLELKVTLPQFDPKKPEYSPELDELGYQIWQANRGSISLLEAGEKAIDYAKKLGAKADTARAEARLVKTSQSDQGITSRSGQRGEQLPDPDSMSDQEMEAWLKANGQW